MRRVRLSFHLNKQKSAIVTFPFNETGLRKVLRKAKGRTLIKGKVTRILGLVMGHGTLEDVSERG